MAPPIPIPIDCDYASYDCSCTGNATCVFTDITFVGIKLPGNGLFGHADLAGNMLEWTLDWYVDPYTAGLCDNCANLGPGHQYRVLRGGSFTQQEEHLTTTYRGSGTPSDRYPGYGVRCARD